MNFSNFQAIGLSAKRGIPLGLRYLTALKARWRGIGAVADFLMKSMLKQNRLRLAQGKVREPSGSVEERRCSGISVYSMTTT